MVSANLERLLVTEHGNPHKQTSLNTAKKTARLQASLTKATVLLPVRAKQNAVAVYSIMNNRE